ncbi:unnamed protein product [Vitrella brassicaformis CCMP3155]|uniref:Eukaryotic translation initiation factor 3 subunit B n=1 Tax=Vitrella brassicaformis (strain CCMP3155) TaxID=1169540 RepID=A0A0G4EV25_VITBC|nr:unnamed protein product [Vitrella brassicaformis CCMP3155]|mmetsp:Transcript_30097/g.74743  ORF Transcript_30097/g.74743 Transcript_30097/m.74743 type:complete len:707 (-) Transcript_30097:287-2407(-)|eukprot:CEM02104.1 unnamed protein product [Vitrella brassicaformis CCMP3155]
MPPESVKVQLADLPEGEEDLLEYLSDREECIEDYEDEGEKEHTFPNTVMVGGAPCVGPEKQEKLQKIVLKLFERFGEVTECEMITDDNKQGLGFFFVTYSSADDAKLACDNLNGHALDRSHTFKAVMLDNYDQIITRTEDYRPPPSVPFFVREHLWWWLNDERQREQLLLRYADETEIYWHDPVERAPMLVYNGSRERAKGSKVWTEFRAMWSPRGSYVTTFHRPGVALWMGEGFRKAMKYEHKEVKHLEFSPDEEYIISWDGTPHAAKYDKAVKIFRTQTGEVLRSFPTPMVAPKGGEFPHFLWSADSKYFAKCSDKDILVYETATMKPLMVEGKTAPLKFPDGLDRFEWSPTDPVLSIWTPERGNSPGRLVLIEIPSRRELATKNVFQVRDAQLHWQSRGDYFCLNVTRTSKSKKTGHNQLEIFRLREKNVPVEMVSLRENLKLFQWENSGSRFAVLLQDETTHAQMIRFYQMKGRGKGTCEIITSFDISSQINQVYWSPLGTHFVLASLGSDGTLLFGNLSADGKPDIVHKDEHFMVNEVMWDPTGRYVITAVTVPMVSGGASAWRYNMEAGFAIWSFQGRLQYKAQKERLYHVAWRPRPPALVSPEKIDEVKKNLKEYSKNYDRIDEELKRSKREEFQGARKEKMDEFLEMLRAMDDARKDHPSYDDWEDGWDDLEDQIEWEEIEEQFEEEIDSKMEVVADS